MEKYVDRFGSMLKGARTDLKLSQAKMAELLDTTVRHYQNLERGRKKPGAEILYKLVHKAGIRPAVVLMLPTSDDNPQYLDICHLLKLCNKEQLGKIHAILHVLLDIPIRTGAQD